MMLRKQLKSVLMISGVVCLMLLLNVSAFAQCEGWSAYPTGRQDALNIHTQYRQLFKQEKYAEALPIWKKVFEYVKCPDEQPQRHLEDGIQIYQNIVFEQTDEAVKKEMVTALVALYNQKAKCIGENAEDLSYKAYYTYYFQVDPDQTIADFIKAIELGKNKTEAFIFDPFARMITWKFSTDQKDDILKTKTIKVYKDLEAIAKANADNADMQEAWKAAQAIFAPFEDALFDCSYFVEQQRPIYEANKGDLDKVKEVLTVLAKKCKCTEANEFVCEVDATFKKLYKIKVEADKGNMKPYERAQYEFSEAQELGPAIPFFEKAIDQDGLDKEKKLESAMKVAQYYQTKNSFSKARTYYRKALSMNPNEGKAYLEIGRMYASSGSRCGPGTGWDSQVVAWAATDMWIKAKSVDASVASEASRLIGRYQAFYPTGTDIFQRGLKEGSSYKIGCWINTTTTIRAAK
jgi:tetratricopeptide (TPR) repeat protein